LSSVPLDFLFFSITHAVALQHKRVTGTLDEVTFVHHRRDVFRSNQGKTVLAKQQVARAVGVKQWEHARLTRRIASGERLYLWVFRFLSPFSLLHNFSLSINLVSNTVDGQVTANGERRILMQYPSVVVNIESATSAGQVLLV
jgi:hypothetical protein